MDINGSIYIYVFSHEKIKDVSKHVKNTKHPSIGKLQEGVIKFLSEVRKKDYIYSRFISPGS